MILYFDPYITYFQKAGWFLFTHIIYNCLVYILTDVWHNFVLHFLSQIRQLFAKQLIRLHSGVVNNFIWLNFMIIVPLVIQEHMYFSIVYFSYTNAGVILLLLHLPLSRLNNMPIYLKYNNDSWGIFMNDFNHSNCKSAFQW